MSAPPEDQIPAVCYWDQLDLDRLPRGCRSRLQVELVHDGLGRPLRVPILVARGEKPGPVFGVTAAVHGNELNGIPVIHRLMDRVDPQRLHGTLVAVAVINVPGYLTNQRYFADGRDLNHVMPGRADGSVSQVYAHRLVDRVINRFDYMVDLHTASFGRVNSLYVRADLTDATAARMAALQRPQIILHNPPADSTLRGTAADLGIPAITVEIGNPQVFQHEYIKSSLAGVRSVLIEVGMLPRRPIGPGPQPVICSRSYWIYTDHGGLLEVFPRVTDRLEKGEVIARLTNIFGDVVREYHAPEAGVVIGKSVNPVAQTGARILHLGIEADSESDLLVTQAEVEAGGE